MALSAVSGQRDLRIDFFRGLALYTILIDHIELNPIAGFTYHRFGFSDMGEAFVFLSGVSCGLFYSGLLARRGWRVLAAALAKRATLLYAFYVASSTATIALIWAMCEPLRKVGALTQQWAIYADSPAAALSHAVLLIEQPNFPGILVLYLELTLGAIPLFLAVARRHAAAAITISGAIWLIPQLTIFGLDQPSRLFPYFNPLAWQFLFCIGMACGMRNQSQEILGTRRHFLLPLAWTVIILSLTWRLYPSIAVRTGLPLGWYRPYEVLDALHKYDLSIARLVHFMSVATVIGAHVGPQARSLRFGHDCIIKTGRWSLEVFSLGTILSVLGTVLFLVSAPSPAEKLAFNVTAILATALLGIGLSGRARRQWRSPPKDPNRMGESRASLPVP